jgi:TM2 domain-containing membrane protein YozV
MANSTTFLIAAAIIVLFFLFCREVVCWYFKINQIVDLMAEISDKLEPRHQPAARVSPLERGEM